MEDWHELGNEIADWLKEYADSNQITALVVGVSGGIDSAVTSTLCAKTGLKTIVLNMPIHQETSQYDLSNMHIGWLKSNWENVDSHTIDLTRTYDLYADELQNHKRYNALIDGLDLDFLWCNSLQIKEGEPKRWREERGL